MFIKDYLKYIIVSAFGTRFIGKIKNYKSCRKNFIYNKRINNSKLGVTYNLFSGEELLEKSILCIREHVDYINVVYQKVSWYGDTRDDNNVEDLLERLKNKKLIDKIILYEYSVADLNDKDSINKHLRHNIKKKKYLGLKDLKNNHCTHCMFMDVDEFYDSEDFKNAKEYIIGHNFSHSAVALYRYFYKPTLREKDIYKISVPFILKLNIIREITDKGFPCCVDSLRCFAFNRFFDKFYFYNNLVMHHMTKIRSNLQLKYNSTEANITQFGKDFQEKSNNLDKTIFDFGIENLNAKVLSDLSGLDFIDVDNIFNI